MTLQQQKEVLTVAIAEFQNYIENADHSNDTNADFICEDIITSGDYETLSERREYIFNIISGLSAFENEILSEDDLDEILAALEGELEELETELQK